MHCQVKEKDFHEIEASNIVQQTAYWADVKHRHGIDPMAFTYRVSSDLLSPGQAQGRHYTGDLLVLIQQVDDLHTVAYVPYGPKHEPEPELHGNFLEELSEVLRPQLPPTCILIRYDLPWENQWANESDYYDHRGNWSGPPPARNQEFRVNFNTQKWNLVKSQSDILPVNTIFLDLDQSADRLLQLMKPKTRYNIRLSHRKGISVQSHGADMLDTWYKLYRDTARRNHITLHDIEFFHDVLATKKDHDGEDVDTRLLMAEHEGEYLAAMFLTLSAKRGTYLYGASSGRNRNLMATYALQWEAIRLASESGCEEYDMFGVAPNPNPSHPMYGLYRFKSGFGGHMFHRMGCWDYPLDDQAYATFRAAEVQAEKYHRS